MIWLIETWYGAIDLQHEREWVKYFVVGFKCTLSDGAVQFLRSFKITAASGNSILISKDRITSW